MITMVRRSNRPWPAFGIGVFTAAGLAVLLAWGLARPSGHLVQLDATVIPSNALLLLGAALLAGALNAVAGGGSFLTFPALVFAGIGPVAANATSTVALWPGAWASVAAYRRELGAQSRTVVFVLGVASLAGGLAGAALLLWTPELAFVRLTPYLLLGATVLFALGRNLATWAQRWAPTASAPSRRGHLGLGAAQFVIAVYGGYFGGGLGVLMLATLAMMGLDNLHQMNALKTLLAACINGVAVAVFVIAGIVAWPQAIIMVVGAIVGGYGGAALARHIAPRWTRGFVIAVGLTMTVYFFAR